MGFAYFDNHVGIQNASFQSNVEEMENPFRNLHPKIYYRQRDTSSKRNISKNKNGEMSSKSSALLTSNENRDQQTRITSSSVKRIEDNSDVGWTTTNNFPVNSPKNDQLRDKADFSSILNGQDKITYLNERNISLSKDSLPEQVKCSFPLIAMARNLSRESVESVNASSAPLRENWQGVLPRIRCGSFISMVHEDERKRHRRGRSTRTGNCETAQDKSLVYALNTGHQPHRTIKDHRDALEQNDISNSRQAYKAIFTADVLKTTKHDCREGEIPRNKANSGENYRIYDHREDIKSKLMVLKAKLHRSNCM